MVRPAAHPCPHRGSPATTTHSRVRWQPYNASLQTFQSRASPSSYLVTPASSISSVSPSPRPLCVVDRPRHTLYPPRECKFRETQKSKYALNLVDQTVKSLCDIWPPQDIPTVFLTSGRPMVASTSSSDQQRASFMPTFPSRNTQLPSPISPTTQPSPITSPIAPYSRQALRSLRVCTVQTQPCDVASMKGFVHEVLRRSRTSGSVLQTALCYLEAIRAKIPELVSRERLGLETTTTAELDDRITQDQVSVDTVDTDSRAQTYSMQAPSFSSSLLATVRINPVTYESDGSFSTELELDVDKPKANSPSLPPLPSLPSPLLCPRRTFLASLILASKFMQDRCYSNRAWAKLSGLPPREIGRCERALGEALEWRLWVGKLPAAQTASTRALTKCKSESDILLARNCPVPHPLARIDGGGTELSPPLWSAVSSPVPMTSSLRRHATLPAGNMHREDPFFGRTDNVSPSVYSSSPSTPGLSYSPTPTESSLGDRTIQMSSFMDISTPPPGQFATFAGAQNDKASAVSSNDLYVRTSSQDVALPSLSHRFDTQFIVSHGVISTNGFGVYNTWGTDYA
ncbi:hypothetical protein PAXRUDRAFT_823180 [Paxillus rubicundulus Ve08.2h10]|uniref:G1/S-specific cyclin n=1 Tax=Paxillus rubicundulus Ve08.2h10 TaxID=930991 RepID=A0A0D0ECB4_9AGAM|nr:hypothetical protein PAXRUDRAFT_823180 [Paxillus rubicundulus Ve08.2h10]